jgi:hypothetical protein
MTENAVYGQTLNRLIYGVNGNAQEELCSSSMLKSWTSDE